MADRHDHDRRDHDRHDHKSSKELEREIDHERDEIARNVEALQEKLSIGGMVDDLLHRGRAGGGAFGSNLGRTISENPVPAMLIGAGVAWLMASGRSHHDERRHGYADAPTHGAEPFPPRGPVPGGPGPYAAAARSGPGVGERASATAEAARHRLGGAAESARSGAHHAADSARDSASHAAHAARERGGAAAGGVSHAASSAGAYASETSEQAARRLYGAGSQAGRYASDTAHSAARGLNHAGQRIRNGFEELMEDQPLVVGGLAFALGAALGGMLPHTRTEDELFGEQADRLRGEAYRAARTEAEKVRRVADAALSEGEREARGAASEAQGKAREVTDEVRAHTPSAREAVEEGERRADDAARRVGDAARSEAERQHLGDPKTGPR